MTSAEVKVGQVWADMDSNRAGRIVRVATIEGDTARIMTITKTGGESVPSYLQRGTTIATRNLSSRYKLIEEQS